MSGFCKKCDHYRYGELPCPCKPFYYRLEKWYEKDDWQETWGFDEDAVARKVVEDDYNDEPCDPMDVNETVIFRRADDSEKRYNVTAEIELSFYSSKAPDCDTCKDEGAVAGCSRCGRQPGL